MHPSNCNLRGILFDVVDVCAQVDMHKKYRMIHKAYELFEKMLKRNVVLWIAMVEGYEKMGLLERN